MSTGMNWLDLSSTSNRYIQTYIKGFVDISGGNLILRNNNLYVQGGDTSLNGNLYVAKKSVLNGDVSLNGNLSLGKNSIIQFPVASVNVSAIIPILQAATYGTATFASARNDNIVYDVDGFETSTIQTPNNNASFVTNMDLSLNGNILSSGAGTSIISSDLSLNKRLFVGGDLSLNGRLFAPNASIPAIALNGLTAGLGFGINTFSTARSDGIQFDYEGFETSLPQTASTNFQFFSTTDLSLGGNLLSSGTGTNVFNGDLSLNNRLFVYGDLSLNGRLMVNTNSITGIPANLAGPNYDYVRVDNVTADAENFELNVFNRAIPANPLSIIATTATTDLSINGNLTAYGSGMSMFFGDVSMGSRLFVTGTTFANTLVIAGDASLNARLFVGGDVSFNSRLFVGSDVSLNSRLFVGGDVSFNSRLIAQKDVSLNARLFVQGNTSLNAQLFVQGDASFNSRLIVAGDVSLNARLSVAGDASFNARLTLGSDASLNGRLFVGGDASFNQRLSVAGDASFNARVFFGTDVSFNARLSVAGDASFNTRLFVGGDASFNSRIVVAGDTSFNQRLFVGADAFFNSRLNVNGDASFNSRVFFGTDISLNARLSVAGDASFNARLFIGGDASFKQRLSVAGDASLNTRLFVGGDASFNARVFVGGNIIVNGFFGIGTTNPQAPLDLTGSMFFDNSYNDKIQFYGSRSQNTNNFGIGVQPGVMQIHADTNTSRIGLGYGYSNVATGAFTETMSIKGNTVGINTTTPAYALDVSGQMRIAGDSSFNGNVVIGNNSAATIALNNIPTMITGPFSANAMTVSTQIGGNIYQNGVYSALSSGLTAGSDVSFAFNTVVSSTDDWISPSTGTNVYSTTTGLYSGTGTTSTTYYANTGLNPALSIAGEWLELDLPFLFNATSYTLSTTGTATPGVAPKNYYLLGWYNNQGWLQLDNVTNGTNTTSANKPVTSNASAYCNKFRIVVNSTYSSTSTFQAYTAIAELSFNGNVIPPVTTTTPYLNILGGLSLPSTMVGTYNLPQNAMTFTGCTFVSGSGNYMNLGAIKMCWGSMTVASTATTSSVANILLPNNFFTEIQSYIPSVQNVVTSQNQYVAGSSATTRAVGFNLAGTASGSIATISFVIMGN